MPELTSKDLEAFRADGVVKIASVLPADQMKRLEEAIDRHLGSPKIVNRLAFGDPNFVTKPNVWKTDPYFFDLAQHAALVDLAARLLESQRINLLQDQIFAKLPGCRKVFEWHNDHDYAPINGTKMVSFWMATRRITLEDGGLEFIRGSHKWNRSFAKPKLLSLDGLLQRTNERETVPDEELTEGARLSFDLDPGDVLAFHGKTLHRSMANDRGEIARKGHAIRFVGDDVTYWPGAHTGISFDGWASQLQPGDVMGGPLFPLVGDGGTTPRRTFAGPDRISLWRVIVRRIRHFWVRPE